jgi:hypothetical protein
MREGLPNLVGHTLWGSKAEAARKAGDEFLNVEFGWLPLASDVSKFLQSVAHLDKLINQYVRDSGRLVRRRFSFPPVVTTTESVFEPNTDVAGPFDYGGLFTAGRHNQGTILRRRDTTVERWFSGAFTYHAPESAFHYSRSAWAWQTKIPVAAKLLGLELDPDVLWELAPWSWAVDWFADVGDFIHNASALSQDGLVMKYGYIMEHSIVRDTYDFIGPLGFSPGVSWTGRPHPLTLISEVKLRRKATPFGFGFDLSALTGRQKAIIAALGLTKVR